MSDPADDITALLRQSHDSTTRDRLFRAVEAELRVLAKSLMQHNANDPAMQTTLLVDEAFLRLVNDPSRKWDERGEFYRLAHGTMRRVFADHTRRRRAEAIDQTIIAHIPDRRARDPADATEQIELAERLVAVIGELEASDPGAANVFMVCFFGTVLSRDEIAEHVCSWSGKSATLNVAATGMGRSTSATHRSLVRALAFLQRRMQDS